MESRAGLKACWLSFFPLFLVTEASFSLIDCDVDFCLSWKVSTQLWFCLRYSVQDLEKCLSPYLMALVFYLTVSHSKVSPIYVMWFSVRRHLTPHPMTQSLEAATVVRCVRAFFCTHRLSRANDILDSTALQGASVISVSNSWKGVCQGVNAAESSLASAVGNIENTFAQSFPPST